MRCRESSPAREVLDRTGRPEHPQGNRPKTGGLSARHKNSCSSACLHDYLSAQTAPFRRFFANAWLFGGPGHLPQSIRQARSERNGRSRRDDRVTWPQVCPSADPPADRSTSEWTGIGSESGTERE